MTGRGGGRNLNFSVKCFIPHEEKILYCHASVHFFYFVHTPVFIKEVLCMKVLCII